MTGVRAFLAGVLATVTAVALVHVALHHPAAAGLVGLVVVAPTVGWLAGWLGQTWARR